MSRWRSPRKPDEWMAAARFVFDDVGEALERHGVSVDPKLKLVAGEAPNPYYEPATLTIGVGMPDPETARGRLAWIFFARLVGLPGPDEAIAALGDQLPWSMAHEVTHHLRHRYGAPMTNNFLEEQVANIVSIAFVQEHPAFRGTIARLRELSEKSLDRLEPMAPKAERARAGFRPELADLLLGQRALTRRRLEDLRRLADVVGDDLDEVVRETGVVEERQLAAAARRHRKARAYFNANYMTNLSEYAGFFSAWFCAYLAQETWPSLGEALEEHVLGEDWERSQADQVRRLMERTAREAPRPDLRRAAKELLAADAGPAPRRRRRRRPPAAANATDWIGRLDGVRAGLRGRSRRTLLRARALREEREVLLDAALRSEGVPERIVRALHAPDPVARRAARDVVRERAPSLAGFLRPSRSRPLAPRALRNYPDRFIRELFNEDDTVLTSLEKLMYLRATPLFRTVPLRALRRACDRALVERYSDGERIFGLGDRDQRLFVITAGAVRIDQESAGGKLRKLATIGPGESFGETGALTEQPRSAAATANGDTTVLTLDRADFVRLGEDEPELLVEVVGVLGQRLRDADRDFG